jgi:cell division protein FtsA
MQTHYPTLFVEITESNYIFVAGIYDENNNLTVLEKVFTQIEGIDKNKFTNIENAIGTIKKNVELIEKKLDCIFKDLTIIIDNFNYSCINISGSKRLNGSQVLKENIFYILNSLKSEISENEKNKTILHIFNSKSVLDGVSVGNLPIGLFGNFYNHELTFFLIGNNDLKNIKQVFNKSNLEVKKIILKSFSEGTQLINQNDTETFFKININKKTSNISFFEKSSFRYSEQFSFGTDVIFKDIEKICSINYEIIENFLLNNLNDIKKFDDKEFLEEKLFTNGVFRKIRKKLIIDIVNARIDEISNIIFNKNINIKLFKQNNTKTYITIKDKLVFEKFKKNFESFLLKDNNIELNFIEDFEIDSSIINTAKLSVFGWKKEAIPITQKKNSIVTRVFKTIFG